MRRVFLRGYKFVYDGYSTSCHGAVANIVQSKGDVVWGGLFKITADCLEALDEYEGHPYFYDRKKFKVEDDKNKIYRAIAYFRTGRIIYSPSIEFRAVVLQGAKDCRLPQQYVETYI